MRANAAAAMIRASHPDDRSSAVPVSRRGGLGVAQERFAQTALGEPETSPAAKVMLTC